MKSDDMRRIAELVEQVVEVELGAHDGGPSSLDSYIHRQVQDALYPASEADLGKVLSALIEQAAAS